MGVSNGNFFRGIFELCKSLLDIIVLEKWDVSKGNRFSFMFELCKSISDMMRTKKKVPCEGSYIIFRKMNISNGNIFSI